jgi:hypothetical protein
MWSPSFIPKCIDWPSHVDVVGEFRLLDSAVSGLLLLWNDFEVIHSAVSTSLESLNCVWTSTLSVVIRYRIMKRLKN